MTFGKLVVNRLSNFARSKSTVETTVLAHKDIERSGVFRVRNHVRFKKVRKDWKDLVPRSTHNLEIFSWQKCKLIDSSRLKRINKPVNFITPMLAAACPLKNNMTKVITWWYSFRIKTFSAIFMQGVNWIRSLCFVKIQFRNLPNPIAFADFQN